MYMPHQWCWRCGRAVPNGFVCRRVVQTGRSQGTRYGVVSSAFDVDHYEPVSLCPACDDEIAAEEQGRLEAGASRLAWWGGLLGSVWGTICLTVAHVPVLLSVVLMWTLARLRVVGCSVLAFYVVAFSMLALGWEPQRYPARILPLWGTITGALVVRRIMHADTLPWPFGWLARGRATPPPASGLRAAPVKATMPCAKG